MDQTLLQIINTVLENRAKPSISEINDSLDLRNDIGLDSLDLAEFTVRLEAEFDVDVFEEGLASLIGEVKDRLLQNHV